MSQIISILVFLLSVFSTTRALNYTNPIIFSDFPDNDVSLGPDGAYYFSASSFQFSPGAPILRSHDLVNWEFIGHSVPMLDFGSGYNMSGTPNYVGGIWASTLRYRQSNKKWYWIGCANFWVTYIYTASSITGPWVQSAQLPGGTCYYDCGLLIDDDDTMYVAYGNTNVSIAQLASDGLSQVKTQQVFSGPTDMQGVEGNRLYKINGTYYVLDDSPQGVTFIWKSSSIWGPWTSKILQSNINGPINGGNINGQGSLVQGPDGNWHFMAFGWAYPAGRIPVMAPITWGSDGWPSLVEVNGAWGSSYQYPASSAVAVTVTGTGKDNFAGTSLGPEWEWNFNPDETKFSVNNGLKLSTATITQDLYAARNTLTHRLYGASAVGTVEIDFSTMLDGDRVGLATFRDQSAWIEIYRSGSSYSVRMIGNATQDPSNSWKTITNGTIEGSATISKGKIWLRTSMNVLPTSDKEAKFSYSTDGTTFQSLGTAFVMTSDYRYFTGYRYGIFYFASKELGGSIILRSFTSA